MEDSRRRQQQQGLQNQAEQRVNYEALQQATRQAQQKAIDTGKPQTVTQDDIGIQRTSILNTKYLASTTPATDTTPEVKTYAVPVVDPKSQQDALRSNYADFQKATLNAQNRSILAENYDNFKASQIMQNPGQTTAYGRANVHYSVGLQDSISGPKQYYISDPTNPFAVSDKPPEQQDIQRQLSAPTKYQSSGNAFVDFGYGVRNYFENIPRGAIGSVEKLTTGKQTTQTHQEVEGEFTGILMDAGKNLIQGKPQTISKDLSDFGARTAENPAYSAGSIYGSAVFNVFTFGAGPIVAKAAPKALGTIGKVFEDIAPKVVKRADAQVFKSEVVAPDLSTFGRTRVSMGRGQGVLMPLVNEGGANTFQRTTLDLGKGSAKETSLVSFKNTSIDLGRSKVIGITDIGSSDAKSALKVRPVKPADFGASEIVRKDGTIQLQKQETAQIAKQATKSTFKNEQVALGSGLIGENQVKSIGITSTAGVKASQTATASKPISLNALGLGGLTGFERKQSRAQQQENDSIFGAIMDSSSMQATKQKQGQNVAQSFIQSTKITPFQAAATKQDTGSLFKTDSLFSFATSPASAQAARTASRTSSKSAFDFGIFNPTRETPPPGKPFIPSPPPSTPPSEKTSRIPPPAIFGFGDEKPKKKGKKGRRIKQSRHTYRANDLLSIELPSLGKALKGFKIE